ncbi:hypothetical protein [Antrihabitans spumae]|uniref:Spheroidene monooxygenase n=2 Tax=Antrihabitans spumae TaxID=3373370 RepID=A0ABW7JJM2_9NOCA
MVTSVHFADVGFRAVQELLREPTTAPGLRKSTMAVAIPLTGRPKSIHNANRIGLVADWDSDDAITEFLATHPVADRLASGWHIRLEPIRVTGNWPDLPTVSQDSPRYDDGTIAALTLARTKESELVRFNTLGGDAEDHVPTIPGSIWATALINPPFYATFSLWRGQSALTEFAHRRGAHRVVIDEDKAQPMLTEHGSLRFRPYACSGAITGRNPIPAFAICPE